MRALGTVEAVGSGVKTVKIGNRVLVSCVSVCGTAGSAAKAIPGSAWAAAGSWALVLDGGAQRIHPVRR